MCGRSRKKAILAMALTHIRYIPSSMPLTLSIHWRPPHTAPAPTLVLAPSVHIITHMHHCNCSVRRQYGAKLQPLQAAVLARVCSLLRTARSGRGPDIAPCTWHMGGLHWDIGPGVVGPHHARQRHDGKLYRYGMRGGIRPKARHAGWRTRACAWFSTVSGHREA